MVSITSSTDTIAAIATAPGESAIGIVRLSGENPLQLVKKLFVSNKKISPYQLCLGWIFDPKTKQKIDQVMVVYFPAPHSYTGEEMIEIQAHGSRVALEQILHALVCEKNVRLAEPGEFTKRAFLNGKLDLSQAESVIDLIQAQTAKSAQLALAQLGGGLSKKVRDAYQAILYVLGYLEASFDFVDDDVPLIPFPVLRRKLDQAQRMIEQLLNSAEAGIRFSQGATVVLIGFPNVGKSSLFNVLLEHDRAIVSALPGTTRDTLREYCDIGGVPVELVDTAGITAGEHEVDHESVRRSIQAIQRADLLLILFDSTKKQSLKKFINELPQEVGKQIQNQRVIMVLNKIDSINKKKEAEKRKKHQQEIHNFFQTRVPLISLSVKNEIGIATIRQQIKKVIITDRKLGIEDILVTKLRHKESLQQALEQLKQAKLAFNKKVALDLIAIDLRASLEALGQITGEQVTEEIIHNIFSRFCVGK